jgi:hypothetical protein
MEYKGPGSERLDRKREYEREYARANRARLTQIQQASRARNPAQLERKREYMREYMRAKRAAKGAANHVPSDEPEC